MRVQNVDWTDFMSLKCNGFLRKDIHQHHFEM